MLQVLLTCDKSAQLCSVRAWDPATGVPLAEFKGNSSELHTLSLVGDSYLFSAVVGKPRINVWSVKVIGLIYFKC